LGESYGVTAGLANVGVVEQPVDGGGGQRFGHQFVEPRWVQVRADRDRPLLIGGVDEPVETLSCVGSDREESDVVDELGFAPLDDTGAQLLFRSRRRRRGHRFRAVPARTTRYRGF
jgi:hypothetical protein